MGSGELILLAGAAMVNAFQVPSQKFDPVHEPAVVHPLAAVLAGSGGRLHDARGDRGRRCRGDIGSLLARADALLSAGQL